MSRHSARTAARPRRRKRSMPRLNFVWAKTGSIISWRSCDRRSLALPRTAAPGLSDRSRERRSRSGSGREAEPGREPREPPRQTLATTEIVEASNRPPHKGMRRMQDAAGAPRRALAPVLRAHVGQANALLSPRADVVREPGQSPPPCDDPGRQRDARGAAVGQGDVMPVATTQHEPAAARRADAILTRPSPRRRELPVTGEATKARAEPHRPQRRIVEVARA